MADLHTGLHPPRTGPRPQSRVYGDAEQRDTVAEIMECLHQKRDDAYLKSTRMKRIALLIGNSHGLPGVKLDIVHWKDFLMSAYGGQWYDGEIYVTMNPARTDLLSLITFLRASKPDFAIVVFSGHGAYQRNTILEINEKEEIIIENELIGITPRQISVFDCCRGLISKELSESTSHMQTFADGGTFPQNIRPCYEERIMNAIPQQVRLYACSVGESALDDGGGLYTKSLLRCSSSISKDEKYKLVGVAHEEAGKLTYLSALRRNHIQQPAAILPRCLSCQQLIIAMNPNQF